MKQWWKYDNHHIWGNNLDNKSVLSGTQWWWNERLRSPRPRCVQRWWSPRWNRLEPACYHFKKLKFQNDSCFQAQLRQDMVKEMKNDFEEDRKKLKQVNLVKPIQFSGRWLEDLFQFQEIRRDFQAEAERMEFEAELKKKEREKATSREQQEYGKNKRWRFQIK